MKTKICRICNQSKPLTNFNKDKSCKDGLHPCCRICHSEANRNYYYDNWERLYQKKRTYYKNNYKKSVAPSRKRTYKKYDVSPVQHKVRLALRSGELIKQPCIFCNNPESVPHHDDYNKPLDVDWICHSCHAELHILYRCMGIYVWKATAIRK